MDLDQEQERCAVCRNRKFDPPKKKCSDPSFHWLLAGREWTKDGDGDWKATETRQARREAFDGLLVKQDTEQEAESIGTVTLNPGPDEVRFHAAVVDGELKLVKEG